MTQTEALKLALEALEEVRSWKSPTRWDGCFAMEITAIKEALAQPEQEPKKFDPNESFAREEAAQARVREFMRNH